MSSEVRKHLGDLDELELAELLSSCVSGEVLARFVGRLMLHLSPSTLDHALTRAISDNPCQLRTPQGLRCSSYDAHNGQCQAKPALFRPESTAELEFQLDDDYGNIPY